MTMVLAELIPLGLAIALSPFSIIPAILLLFTGRPRATGSAYLAGWILGIATTATVFTGLASVVEERDVPRPLASWARIILGLALLVLATGQWRGRRAPRESPAWMRSIESAGPARAFRLGFLLTIVNPKILLFSVAAGLAVGSAELTTADAVAAIAAFTGVAASSVAIPVALYLVLGERMRPPLSAARGWLDANNAVVMSIVLAVIGVLVLAEGVAAL